MNASEFRIEVGYLIDSKRYKYMHWTLEALKSRVFELEFFPWNLRSTYIFSPTNFFWGLWLLLGASNPDFSVRNLLQENVEWNQAPRPTTTLPSIRIGVGHDYGSIGVCRNFYEGWDMENTAILEVIGFYFWSKMSLRQPKCLLVTSDFETFWTTHSACLGPDRME